MIAAELFPSSDTPVSDRLAMLCQCLRAIEAEGRALTPRELAIVRRCVEIVRPRILDLEREALRRRWSPDGQHEAIIAERLAAELSRPGTNVQPLHPGFAEVPFSDGRDGAA